jgi:hypothetical protein
MFFEDPDKVNVHHFIRINSSLLNLRFKKPMKKSLGANVLYFNLFFIYHLKCNKLTISYGFKMWLTKKTDFI